MENLKTYNELDKDEQLLIDLEEKYNVHIRVTSTDGLKIIGKAICKLHNIPYDNKIDEYIKNFQYSIFLPNVCSYIDSVNENQCVTFNTRMDALLDVKDIIEGIQEIE